MPYIKKEIRGVLDPEIEALITRLNRVEFSDGNVNYTISRLIDALYGSGGYAVYNRAMGVLDCVAREFYRRKVVPYEEIKKVENGDVYVFPPSSARPPSKLT